MKLQEFRCYFREVGRATVPANAGRHGGRPYFGIEVSYQVSAPPLFVAAEAS